MMLRDLRTLFFTFAACALWAFAALSAPVPRTPPPAPVTADELVGTWVYQWASQDDGRITFHADGTYVSRHSPDGCRYVGTWNCDGERVTLWEYRMPTAGEVGCPSRYEFTVARSPDGALAGVYAGGTPVVLSDPDRE